MRIDRMEKLDRIKFYETMHSNLVKWWNVNMVEPDEVTEEEAAEEDDYDADAAAEELLADALSVDAAEGYIGNTDSRGYGYGLDGSDLSVPEPEDVFNEDNGMDPEAVAAAMEIFNRLQAEAAADEAAKQAEIEAAKASAAE
ncbi:MAG: hypothetical protein K6E50_09560 [Lachnospiraceae bacterium]|nr:hypothetical protein [Lachnospiraceae bacterium]